MNQDRQIQEQYRRVNIIQGSHYVDNDPNVVLTTILGSCVAACLWDPQAGVGGMNHFLLPGEDACKSKQPNADIHRYGVNLMELLINDLLRHGAVKSRLKAKLFGGAAIVKGLTDIGSMNAKFAENFLSEERIELVTSSLRGVQGRRLQFWPVGGRARQAFLTTETALIISEEAKRRPEIKKNEGEVELF